MYLILFLDERLTIDVMEDDAASIRRHGREYVDVCLAWEDSLYLGFYDWLRTPDVTGVIGLRVTLHDGRESLRDILPRRSYIEWISEYIVVLRFVGDGVDDELSSDQEFSASRCLRAQDGSVALLFDASVLTPEQIASVRHLAPAASSWD
jgi:hypothetical protein